jgi:hypothetical protein
MCITFGKVAKIVDHGAMSCGTAGALYAMLALVEKGSLIPVYKGLQSRFGNRNWTFRIKGHSL